MFAFINNLFFKKKKKPLKITHLQIMTKSQLFKLGKKHNLSFDKKIQKSELVHILFDYLKDR